MQGATFQISANNTGHSKNNVTKNPKSVSSVNKPLSSWGCCDAMTGITVLTLISLKSAELLLSGSIGIIFVRIVQMVQEFWEFRMFKKKCCKNLSDASNRLGFRGLNATVCMSIVADHFHPFMTTVYQASDGSYQQDNAPCPKAQIKSTNLVS